MPVYDNISEWVPGTGCRQSHCTRYSIMDAAIVVGSMMDLRNEGQSVAEAAAAATAKFQSQSNPLQHPNADMSLTIR